MGKKDPLCGKILSDTSNDLNTPYKRKKLQSCRRSKRKKEIDKDIPKNKSSRKEVESEDSSSSGKRKIQNQKSAGTPSKGLSHQDITNIPKSVLKPNSDNGKRSRYSLRLSEGQSSKKAADTEVLVKHSKEKTVLKPSSDNVKRARYSLRLSEGQSSKKAADTEVSVKHSQKKSVLKPSSDNVKKSRCSLRLSECQSTKKTTDAEISLKHSQKKATSAKKQKLAKNVDQSKTSEQPKESASTFKRQTKSASNCQRDFLSFTGDIPIDDLALWSGRHGKRKVKSDVGCKMPGKSTVKQKLSAIEAVVKADEDYEDDLFESRTFDKFKELLKDDSSDSEMSFAISTPKFPITPLIRHKKTPHFKDCFSPTKYAIQRKAAIEYMCRNKKRKSAQKQPPKTPEVTVKKKLEYSKVLEDAEKLCKSLESQPEDESDNDSYFNFD